MLVSRCGIAILAASLSACGASHATDSGRDGWSYDAIAYDVAPRTDVPDGDDVMPTVDVVAFDASATDSSTDQLTPGGDAAVNSCTLLAEQYAIAVRDAQSCTTSSDCSAVVCETLCCNCHVYVNGQTTLLDRLTSLEAAWQSAGCADMALCTATACGGLVSTECTSAGRCATVHRGD